MPCGLPREDLDRFLEGRLAESRRLEVEQHVETCDACQGVEIVGAEWGALLRDKLTRVTATAALRARIVQQLGSPAGSDARVTSTAAPFGLHRVGRYRRLLHSNWAPRVAMAAMLGFLMLVPDVLLNRTPAMATSAAKRHACHAPSFGVGMPPCCTDLHLAVGDRLAAPAAGAAVPGLGSIGLDLATATRCSFDNVVVNQIGYRTLDSAMFSLYITDQVAEQFMQIHTESVGGVERARHRLAENDVTIWERDGLVYLWVGPYANAKYETALASLMNGQ